MKKIYITVLKTFGMRFYMVASRAMVSFALIYAFYYSHYWLYILAFCLSFPLLAVALWRFVETLTLYKNISENIENIERDAVKKENKNYIKNIK